MSSTFERIFITVKTYPTISKTYGELSCTAGFREDGSWVRLYPIPFRLLSEENQYKKYQWIKVKTYKSDKDNRPESYRVVDFDDIEPQEHIAPQGDWHERRKIVLKNDPHENFEKMIAQAKENKLSLAVFKPAKITGFVIEDDSEEWKPEQISKIKQEMRQYDLFKNRPLDDFKPARKLPKKFFYKFKDDDKKERKLMIADWEIGQLYWNCLKQEGDAEKAVQKVRQKYFDDFAKTKDLHLFLGTTLSWHQRAPNPFIIIGTFHPKPEEARLF